MLTRLAGQAGSRRGPGVPLSRLGLGRGRGNIRRQPRGSLDDPALGPISVEAQIDDHPSVGGC